MQLLLGGDGEIQITEEIVKVAARGNGKEIVQLLLSREGEVQITEVVVKAAAGNELEGKEMMTLLLDRGREIASEPAVRATIQQPVLDVLWWSNLGRKAGGMVWMKWLITRVWR
jgi:hypothetical protein